MNSSPAVLSAFVLLEDGIYEMDCAHIDGELWLVPEWIDNIPRPGLSTPARAIRATFLPQSKGPDGRIYLCDPIPTAVLEGQEAGQYEVVDALDWYVELPKRH